MDYIAYVEYISSHPRNHGDLDPAVEDSGRRRQFGKWTTGYVCTARICTRREKVKRYGVQHGFGMHDVLLIPYHEALHPKS